MLLLVFFYFFILFIIQQRMQILRIRGILEVRYMVVVPLLLLMPVGYFQVSKIIHNPEDLQNSV